MTDGKLSYRDPKRKLELDGTISTAMGKAGEQPQAELSSKASSRASRSPCASSAARSLMLRDTKQPYPLDLDVTFGATKLKAKGTVQGSLPVDRCQRPALAVGPRPRRHLSVARHPRPTHAALQHHRQAASRIRRLEVHPEQVACRRQRSHRRGRNRRTPRNPAILTAKLVSQKLVFADLAPLVGAPPDKPAATSRPSSARPRSSSKRPAISSPTCRSRSRSCGR